MATSELTLSYYLLEISMTRLKYSFKKKDLFLNANTIGTATFYHYHVYPFSAFFVCNDGKLQQQPSVWRVPD